MADKITRLDAARERLDKEAAAEMANDWRAELAPSGSGFLGDERNILIALRSAPELAGLVRFNEFALNVELCRPPPWHRDEATGSAWTEADDYQCGAWLQQAGIKLRGTAAIGGGIEVVARERAYHPVQEYLNALSWDAEPRLQLWLAEYLDARAEPVYLAAVGSKFLISAVARIMQPGCQADHVLALEAPQGAGKTSAARALAVRPEWFAGDLPDIHGKDARLQLAGHWVVEIAELKAIRAATLEAQKSFLTQTHDTFRPPYGRRAGQFPRQSVFIATTNASAYLRDRSGNRRWWPVQCGRIDVAALLRDRDQLWAEALHLFRAGSAWHLTEAEGALAQAEQRQRLQLSELEEEVRDYLATLPADQREITVREVLCHALHLEPDKPTYADSARRHGPAVAEALESFGWQKVGRLGGEKRTTYRRASSGKVGQEK